MNPTGPYLTAGRAPAPVHPFSGSSHILASCELITRASSLLRVAIGEKHEEGVVYLGCINSAMQATWRPQ